MSARNYTRCPKCIRQHNHTREAKIKRVESLYGKLPAAEWQKRMSAAIDTPEPEDTLGEYYEHIWDIEAGTFRVRYSVHCSECGFEWSLTHNPVTVPELKE